MKERGEQRPPTVDIDVDVAVDVAPTDRLVETHLSWVIFLGDRVLKIKKPIRTPYIDLTSLAARGDNCANEVSLNRRLAPDVYREPATLQSTSGGVLEHVVVMRRLPDDRRLTRIVTADEDQVRSRRAVIAVARRLADFHRTARRSRTIDERATAAQLDRRWRANTNELRSFSLRPEARALVDEIETLATRYTAGRDALLRDRVDRRRVVDGHGDVQADDVFCLDDGPRIIDCLEFDDDLRCGDGLADVCFLAMDLERLGRADLAHVLLAAYAAAADDDWPTSLHDHYVAYSAQVRAKVGYLRAQQRDETAADAEDLLRLAVTHLRRARVRLVLVGGAPGTGKSTVAAALAGRPGWDLLRSDLVRKQLFDRPGDSTGTTSFASGIYTPVHTDRTYSEMLRRADERLRLGHSVVLDATWYDGGHREQARAVAEAAVADVVELRCTLPPDVAAERIVSRHRAGGDASDATPEVAREIALRMDPWPEAVGIDTSMSPGDSITAAVAAVNA